MELVAIQKAHGTDLLHGILRRPAIGRNGRPVCADREEEEKKQIHRITVSLLYACKPIIYTIP